MRFNPDVKHCTFIGLKPRYSSNVDPQNAAVFMQRLEAWVPKSRIHTAMGWIWLFNLVSLMQRMWSQRETVFPKCERRRRNVTAAQHLLILFIRPQLHIIQVFVLSIPKKQCLQNWCHCNTLCSFLLPFPNVSSEPPAFPSISIPPFFPPPPPPPPLCSPPPGSWQCLAVAHLV